MIKKEELRIGNILNYTTSENDIYKTTIDWQDLKWISEDPKGFNLVHHPIPLTEEWIIKLGLISNPYKDRYEIGNICIECDKTKGFTDLWIEKMPHIKYVHQLQNLYFALTGKEL
jgi:hypothetical protein